MDRKLKELVDTEDFVGLKVLIPKADISEVNKRYDLVL